MAAVTIKLIRIEILDDHDYGKGELHINARVIIDGDKECACYRRIPETGTMSISDLPGKNRFELGATLFDGGVPEGSELCLEVQGIEEDLIADDRLVRYERHFRGEPASWAGRYAPDKKDSPESMTDWKLWISVEVC